MSTYVHTSHRTLWKRLRHRLARYWLLIPLGIAVIGLVIAAVVIASG